MKILLQAKEIMARRPQWTDKMLASLVDAEGKRHSEFSRAGRGVSLYDMAKVIEAEKNPAFIIYQAKRKGRNNETI